MELRLKPTEQFFMADEVMVRMWTGSAIHDNGASEPVIALITAVGFAGQTEVIAEGLVSIPPPTPQDAERWARRVLGDGGEG